jgi:hypothetical protein
LSTIFPNKVGYLPFPTRKVTDGDVK